ncbi:MAG: Flp pilus assembly protein CpaB [Dehalococcoidia bacterium]|nr:Flp pilus assembly protein CpaB [Dehalococcoidia bacterium]
MARIQGLTIPRGSRGLLILALITGLVAAILVFVALNQGGGSDNAKTESAVTTSAVVVAESDIAAGTTITADMLKVIEVPNSLLVKDAFSGTQRVVGETARYPIAAGEQLTLARVGAKTEGDGLAFVVPAGMRAIAVSVDEITGVGGLILPGDRADVIAVISDQAADANNPDRVVTVLQDVEVLAVAQSAQEPVPAAAADNNAATQPEPDASSTTSGQPPENAAPQPSAHTVTLALTPEQVQLLALVQEEGSIYLSLRHFGDKAQPQLPVIDLSAILGPQ